MHERPPIPARIAKIDRARAAAARPEDARRYAALAHDLGARLATDLDPSRISVDDRVAVKCAVPKCFGYNTCANCPPHAPTPDQMRRLLPQYGRAVVFGVEVRPEAIVRDRETIAERVTAYQCVSRIVCELESRAFYDGHYLSVGFGAGSCKSTFCHDVACAVLAGEKCRHNLVARPSMEAVGLDCFALATELGWDIYPVGSSAEACQVPSGLLLGLVLVA